MRRVGIGAISILILISLIFGAMAGAAVGAAVAIGVKPTQKVIVQKEVASSGPTTSPAAVTRVVPVVNWVNVVKRVGPAVVTIIHQLPPQQDFFGFEQPGGQALGSGFIIDKQGDIVTNAHVVNGAHKFTVIFANGKKTSATLVGENDLNDIAVIKVNVPVPAVAKFGDSSQLQPGEPVIAIGNALGEFQNTVTAGIISGLHRTIPGFDNQDMHDMIQTDAAINHGNSGGPLLDMSGNVIGINTAVERSTQQSDQGFGFGLTDPNASIAEGLGFAIPSNIAASIAARIISHGPPAFLGVEYHEISQTDSQIYNLPVGAYIIRVVPGGPAAHAGLRARDIITAVDGIAINDSVSLEQIIANHKPGDRVTLTVWRNGAQLKLHVTLGRGH
jgi:S1-C subfamily serine protease